MKRPRDRKVLGRVVYGLLLALLLSGCSSETDNRPAYLPKPGEKVIYTPHNIEMVVVYTSVDQWVKLSYVDKSGVVQKIDSSKWEVRPICP